MHVLVLILLFPFALVFWLVLQLFKHWMFTLIVIGGFILVRVLMAAGSEGGGSTSTAVTPTQDYTPADASRRMAKLAAIENFSTAVIQVQANTTLSAHEKLVDLAQLYVQERDRLVGAGQLTAAVDASLLTLVEKAETALTGQSAEFGTSLQTLIRTYDGRTLRGRGIKRRYGLPE